MIMTLTETGEYIRTYAVDGKPCPSVHFVGKMYAHIPDTPHVETCDETKIGDLVSYPGFN